MTEGNNLPEKNSDLPDERENQNNIKAGDYFRQGMRLFRKVFLILWETITKTTSFIALLAKGNEKDEGVTGDIHRAFSHLNFKKMVLTGTGALVLLYLLTGVYVVNPGEVAVVKLFGKVVKPSVSEGLHYRFPWPIQTVDVVNISAIRREGIGLMLPEHKSIHSSPEIIQFLTGDENIIDIKAVVQYRIKDAPAYLYNVKYPPYLLINETIRSAITEIGGSMEVDEILTIGKERLQGLIRTKAEKILDKYESGLELVGINLNKVYPPEEVAEAFRDVSNARQDKEKTINNALGYRNTIIPQARGDAEKTLRQGEAYKIDVINRSRGDAAKFDKMLVEYEKNKKIYSADVTRLRLYLETMEKVMGRVKKYLVNTRNGGKVNLRLFQGE
jgi:membrane protease subunit HflK